MKYILFNFTYTYTHFLLYETNSIFIHRLFISSKIRIMRKQLGITIFVLISIDEEKRSFDFVSLKILEFIK